MITYACDGEFHPRLRYHPAADYKPGELLEIKDWSGNVRELKHAIEHGQGLHIASFGVFGASLIILYAASVAYHSATVADRRSVVVAKQNMHLIRKFNFVADGIKQKIVGLILDGRGVLRGHQKVIVAGAATDGEITSGTFSPSLQKSIALARVPVEIGDTCQVEIRGKLLNAAVVKPVFVRDGQPV